VTYDPEKHNRHSVRLKGYDYSQLGAYFVTICTRDRASLFGEMVDGETRLNDAGEIARRCWADIPHHFLHAVLDAVVIMPNHVHGVIVIRESRRGEASATPIRLFKEPGESDASPLQRRPNGTQPGSLSAIVQNFKSVSTRRMNAAQGAPGTPIWQRGYYEHVIRNEAELTAIREYILGNPARWTEDENNPALLNTGQ